jgi:hypothetical protein
MVNPLKKWVLVNKYYIKISDNKEKKVGASHFLLDGGIWNIPKSEYLNFLKLLSTDLNAGEKHYITENKTNVFRFICDLDFFDESEILNITEIVNIIQEIIKEYYILHGVIICGADTKIVNERVKSGFHLVWPKIWLTKEMAKKFRILFIENLTKHFGVRPDYNSWSDVVDLSVYDDNGLRMIGCRKMGICKSCKNKKEFRENCESCDGVGRKDEGRVYTAKYTLDYPEEYIKTIKNDIYVLLLETSIYNYNDFPESTLIHPLPEIDIPITKKKKKETSNENFTKIENFIKRNYKDHKIKIKKVNTTPEAIFVIPEDNFCMNVNRNHTSSGIYFDIKPAGICQRCYCKRDTLEGRLNGLCSGYSSNLIPLSPQLKTFLFGATIKEKFSKKEKKISNVTLSRNSSTATLDLSSSVSRNMFTNKEICLENCKNILYQLEQELV